MIDLGININTKDGIEKADEEIKVWIEKLQKELQTKKIKVDFEMPKDVDKYFKEIKYSLDGLNKAFEGLDQSSKKASDGQKSQTRESKNASKAINTYKDKVKELESAWAQLSASQRKGAEGKQLLRQVRSLNNQYGQYKGTIAEVIAQEKRHEQSMKRSVSTMSSLKNMALSYISIYQGIRIAKQMADITGEFEMQKAALAAILQDAERANTLFSQIKTLAVVSPFEVKDLISYTKQLSAFSVPYNELYETTKRLADISAGLGVDMSRLILAYGQVRSAEVLRGQELRQFTEAGIPLIEELRKKFQELGEEGITTAEVFDKIYTRQVPFEMVRDVMFEMSDEGGKFFEMQEIQADTLKGKITNLTDAYNIFLSEIGDKASPILKGFIDFLREMMEHHESMTKAVIAGGAAYGVMRVGVMLLNVQMKGLRATMATMPWGAFAIAISAVVFKIMSAIEATKDLQKFTEELASTMDRLSTALTEEEIALRTLFLRLERATKGSKEFAEIKNEIVRKYGSYLDNLDQEIEKTEDLNLVLNKVLLSYMDIARTKASASFMESSEASYAKTSAGIWDDMGVKIEKQGYTGKAKARILRMLSDYMQDIKKEGKKIYEKDVENISDDFNQVLSRVAGKNRDGSPIIEKTKYSTKLTKELMPLLQKELEAHTELMRMQEQAIAIWGKPYKELTTEQQEGILNVNKLLDMRRKLNEELKKAQEPAYSPNWNEGVLAITGSKSIKGIDDAIKDINEKLKLLGYEDPKDARGGRKTIDATIKDMLERIRREIDEYNRRESIYETLTKDMHDFEMDFQFTVNGEPNLFEFIKKQMEKVSRQKLNFDFDLKTGTFEDMMKGVDLSQVYTGEGAEENIKLATESLQSWFQELRRMQMVEYDGIQKVLDAYALYTDKKRELDVKYEEDKKKLQETGAEQGYFDEQDRLYKESTEKLILEFATRQETFTDFMEEIAEESLEQITNLLFQAQMELERGEFLGIDENALVILRAKVIKLREELDKSRKEAANEEDKANKTKDKSFAQWKKLQTVLGKVQSEFKSLGDTIGGTTGEILSAAGDISTSTISMISGIELLTKSSVESTKLAAEKGEKAIDKVEKASVILSIVSAALQILTKISSFFIKDTQISQEVIDQYNSLVSVINEVTDAQKEMLDALSGADAVKQLEESIELMEKQEQASRNMGRAFLDSGASRGFLGIGSSASEGVKMMEKLEKFRRELAKIGIDYDKLGGRGKGIFELTEEQIKTLKEKAPEAWAALGSEVQEYLNNIEEAQKKIIELQNAWKETATGASFDELKDGLDEFLLSADSTFEDVAKNFEDYMLQAILRVVKAKYLNDQMQKWYDSFAKAMKDDVLSDTERRELEQSYIDMAEEAKRRYEAMVDIAGIERSMDSNLTGISKGISEMSEDTALILGGYLDSIRFKLFPYIDFMMTDYNSTIRIISNAQVQSVTFLSQIESNTRVSASKVTELVDMMDSVIEVGSDGRKIRI